MLLEFIPFANANVDPKVHKLCLPATDYLGCVKAMTTKSTDFPSMRMIDGGIELSSNSCPIDFVYIGSGRCRNFVVNMKTNITFDTIALWAAGHVDRPIWNYYYKLDQGTKAIFDKNCPKRQPFLYSQSSCKKNLLHLH